MTRSAATLSAARHDAWATASALIGKATQPGANRQALTLAGAQVASSALGAVAYALAARALSSREFDALALCVASILPSFELLFDPGITPAAARALALAENGKAERRALGALVLLGLGAGCLFVAAVGLAAPLASSIYPSEASPPLLAAAPLALAIPLQRILEQACQGANRIGLLAASRLLVSTANLAAVLAISALGDLTPASAAIALLGGNWVSVTLLVCVLRPSFSGARDETRRIAVSVREFGAHVYAGRLVAFASGRLDLLLVPYLAGATDLGMYSFAQKLFQPLSGAARAAAATRYKSLALAPSVGRTTLVWNAAWITMTTTAAVVCAPIALGTLFGPALGKVASFVLPCSVAALFGGLVQPYNVFLAAHGRGRELRRIAFATCLTSLSGLVLVVPTFGILGAAWWSAVSAGVHFALHVRWYGRVVAQDPAEP